MARTRRVDPASDPGLTRLRRGRGFSYLDTDGRRIEDEPTIDRIRALAIPPAWTDVWICADPYGHIQATGIDTAGRKQYRYHDLWRRRRDAAKFDAMIAFARALPQLRRRVRDDLRGDAVDRVRVLACAVRLLDVGFFRIGSEDYAEQNETYGLTTLRRSHARVEDGVVVFDYPAKHGLRRVQQVLDEDAREIVRALKRRRGGGPELLAFKERRRWVDVKADDVNAYLKEAAGGDFSAKDFRTWNATALMAVALAVRAEQARTRASRRRIVTAAVREVATFLGNTPAVCRRSYVDPRVIDRFQSGLTIAEALAEPAEPVPGEPVEERPVDEQVRRAVLDLIAGDEDSKRVERVG
ncbi:DNA topoisomerase IB [Conexibacter stalactiti]|uniref:DNA topoisomerase n=1 Tax=Conexibacter stalactiti TaxID=1940611 RepID=A0ABU4HT42_9ACTN|nr:DNA topoisomerase IB [Conexibacter stalactiti]MDW5596364.1 DNA topoisomerase IB [Conexibacter stalactiti]MEC5037006.1 DNA topoisomerase IB [Conexibacter stalactiti]